MNAREEQKQKAKYMLASIVESSQDSIVTIDLDRVITSWNAGAENLYGYPASEVVGKSLDIVMLPEDIVGLIAKIDSIIHEVSVPLYETVRLHKNGRQADLQIALSPVRDESGEVVGISTIARDITEAKLHEQLKDEFIAVASHELKTPITSIKAYTDILVERFTDSSDSTSFSIVTKLGTQVDRMIELLKTLLDTTKLSAGQVLLKMEEFDLCALIRDLLEPLQMVSKDHRLVYESGDSCIVVADKKLISQAIVNLVSNAIKYSPRAGMVRVSTERIGRGIQVNVQDFGIGIPDGLRSKIFERYFRVSNKQVSGAPSIGLGLYITAKIIDQHGGKIFVDSKEGIGSTFSFVIPVKTQSAESRSES